MSPAVVARVRTLVMSMDAAADLVVRGAHGVHGHSDFLLVEITDSDGRVGYGEVSATPGWSGEDAWTAEHFVRDVFAPALRGHALDAPAELDDLMDALVAGNHFTKAGVSTALWDLRARQLEISLAEALGGVRRREIPIKCSLSGNPEQVERSYAYARSMGFGSFKVKVGTGVDRDVERVAHVRRLAGPETSLGVDANAGWSLEEAGAAIEAMTPSDVRFVEQPVAARDLSGMRALRGRGLPVVADESVGDIVDLRDVVAAGAADVASIYIGMSGGPAKALLMARFATSSGLGVVIGSNGEMGIGAAAQLHVAAAAPQLSADIPSDIIGAHYYDEDILAEPLDSDGRRVRLTRGPGLGVVPRDDLVARFV